MSPEVFVPPIHFLHMLVLRKVVREPSFVTERDIVGDIGTKARDCIDIEMVIMGTKVSERGGKPRRTGL
jgi:hypothetical protein